MKTFLVAALVAVVSARPDQSHHQSIKLGHAPSVSSSVFKPHFAAHAEVASQPHAAPQAVESYNDVEKAVVAVGAPAAVPHHGYAPHHAAPYTPHHAAPYVPKAVAHTVVPAHHNKAHHVPVHHAPVHHAPVHHAPAYTPEPAYKPAPSYKPAPAYHHEENYAPSPYAYEYAVADDYSGAAFNAAETSDGGHVSGTYSVALPDGRTQHVKYTAGGYDGYVADVSYEGYPTYPEAKPYHPAPAYAPAPYHA